MHSLLGFTIFGVDWEFFKPYLVLGFALGGVYALSGVGLVVLYRSTGVVNLAFGAIGGAGALIAWWLRPAHGHSELARSISSRSPSAASSPCSTASSSGPPSPAATRW